MPGLVPDIHVLMIQPQEKTWMAGTEKLAMTGQSACVSLPAHGRTAGASTGMPLARDFR